MKIGLLTQEYHLGENRFGGVGRAFGKMAHWLAEHGHEVTVYYQARRAEEFLERPNLRVVTVTPKSLLPWRARAVVNRLPTFWGGVLWHWEVNAALSDRIMSDYRNGRIEVLLTNRGVTAPSLMIRRRLPTVVRAQCSRIQTLKADCIDIKLSDWWLQILENIAIKFASQVFAPSQYVSEDIFRRLSVDVKVIRTPMFTMQSTAEYKVVSKKYKLPSKYVLYWGSFQQRKGLKVLANALPYIFQLSNDLKVVVVGEKSPVDEDPTGLDRHLHISAMSSPDRLHILPSIDQPELFSIISNARVAVLPSILDNLPNTLLEAMFLGAIVVGTYGSSIDELIVNGINGLLVEQNNPEFLARIIVKADQMSEADRMVMSQAAKARVQEVCGPEKVMNRVVALCGDAITTYARR
jgi:glycosyltransferase involved in cell wall biosynthesis